MAKIILPVIFDKLSGTIEDSQYYQYNKIICVKSYKPYKKTVNSLNQLNQQKAFAILLADYQIMKQSYPLEYESWIEETKVLESKLQRSVNIIQLYTAFFLVKYNAELGNDVEPLRLTGGIDGYGVCRYGLGKYGVIGRCATKYHYNDRFLRKWVGFDRRLGYGTLTYGVGKFGTFRF